MFGLAKSRRLRGRSVSLKRSYKDDAAYFFDNTARDDGHTATEKFRLDIRKKLVPRIVVKSWYRPPEMWGNCSSTAESSYI